MFAARAIGSASSPLYIAGLLQAHPCPQIVLNSRLQQWGQRSKQPPFEGEEKGAKFIFRVKEDGSELQKVVRIDSAPGLFGASPDGKWLVIPGSSDEIGRPAMLYPVGGGSPIQLCLTCLGGNDVERVGPPGVIWSPDGKFLYLNLRESIYAIPLRPDQMLPPIPTSGFRSKEDVAANGEGKARAEASNQFTCPYSRHCVDWHRSAISGRPRGSNGVSRQLTRSSSPARWVGSVIGSADIPIAPFFGVNSPVRRTIHFGLASRRRRLLDSSNGPLLRLIICKPDRR